jgi:hypothetical protein
MFSVIVSPADLIKFWSMPKTTDTRQITLRLPLDVFYKLQAFEQLFPNRSRNEMISDLLSTALDLASEALPFYDGPIIAVTPDGEEIRDEAGPRRQFRMFYESFKESSKIDDDKPKNALRVEGPEAA